MVAFCAHRACFGDHLLDDTIGQVVGLGGHLLDDTIGQVVGLIFYCCFIVWGHVPCSCCMILLLCKTAFLSKH